MNFDIISEDKASVFYLSSFEEMLDKINFVKYSDSFIEIPGIIIFSSKNDTLRQMLNPSLDILSVSQDDLKSMIEEIEKKNFFFMDGFLKPKGIWGLNLEKIKNELILYKESETFIIVNNMLFTIDSIEFHGSFFGGRDNLFLVSSEELKKLKEYFRSIVS
jgi:hypothetical protein